MTTRGRRARRWLALAGTLALACSAEATLPPFAADLERLAEVLGSLQFLAELCGRPTDWRHEMEALLALAPTEADDEWQARLVDRYNLGFSSFGAVYRSCTISAQAAITYYRQEGAAITADIAARYGNLAVPADD
jgi:uncharacterized protein (TIGR02301 family)